MCNLGPGGFLGGIGVMDLGLLRVICLLALRKKMPIHEISRRTVLSHNMINKYLGAGIVEPQFQSLDRPSKLDPFAGMLSGWRVTEQRKSRKERRTVKQRPADLVQRGVDGSYELVSLMGHHCKCPIITMPTMLIEIGYAAIIARDDLSRW